MLHRPTRRRRNAKSTKPRIYDSEDPNLPNLPGNDEISWSDYEGYLTDTLSDDSQSIKTIRSSTAQSISKDSLISEEQLQQSLENSVTESSSIHHSIHPPQRASSNEYQVGKMSNSSTAKRLKKMKKRKKRKYKGSHVKKERTGWEPGIDVNTTKVEFSETPGSTVTITDYSKKRYHVERYDLFSANGLAHFLEVDPSDPNLTDESRNAEIEALETAAYMAKVSDSIDKVKSAIKKKPQWSDVRWINVNGLSWEAISILSDYFNLHRLAVEDMVDIPQRTKVDLYSGQLFVVLPLIKLIKIQRPLFKLRKNMFQEEQIVAARKQSEEEVGSDGDGDSIYDTRGPISRIHDSLFSSSAETQPNSDTPRSVKSMSLNDYISDESRMRKVTDMSFESISYDKRYKTPSSSDRKRQLLDLKRPLTRRGLSTGIEQVSLFLLDSNTVISFFEHSANDVEKAILTRLSSEYTILRETNDPSLLFQAILDTIVDLNSPVMSAYIKRIHEFEFDILMHPSLEHTQELHLMTNEFSYLKSKILPISAMVQQLRQPQMNQFMTDNSKLYLNDVYDHLITCIDDIETMTRTIENLIDMIFNTLSMQTNDSMQSLSLITVVFLPLSFWTGYYGMNFEKFGDLSNNVSYYWKIAVPFTCFLILLITFKTIIAEFNRYKKTMTRAYTDWKFKRAKRAEIKERRKKRKAAIDEQHV
ncbi:unnamed protein product [Ambrosiozyma monospora]|uniref:Unnamed protein product n=1 Tax=Ambrosiozyma monospora TaxID=43982 RepID=A0A9W6YTC7_AMBMO|nr:unnamed protein product [Ambrosiozyma monospora]